MSQPVVESVGSHYNISGSEGTFTVPGLGDEKYWLKVDKTTGNIQIWNENVGIGMDADVGTLNPNTGEISFYDNKSYTINGNEVHEDKIFSTQETQSFIISKARETVIQTKTKELIDAGLSPEVAAQQASLIATDILGTNATTGEQTTETSVNTEGFILKEKVIATQRDEMAGKPGTHLVYPQDHADGDFDFIKIVPIEYVPQLQSGATWNKGLIDLKQRYRQKERVVGATMFLPMVPGISESNQVDWGGESLNPLQLAAGNVAAGMINTIGDKIGGTNKRKTWTGVMGEIGTSMGKAGSRLMGNAQMRDFIVNYFAGKAVGANLLGRAGVVVNPNLEVLFNGPKLRTFSYNFTFTPRDDRESKTVKTIIKVIKKAMAPKRRKAAIFLNVPAVFKIKYLMQGNREHPFLNKIKPCALTGFNVDYTPGGSYMTYGDGSMTSYGVSLNFAELEPIYNDDVEIDSPDMGY